MSHIFISYAHADKQHLDRLITWLKDEQTAQLEVWYDQHIESGNNWRDEIAAALDEAFVVLPIITEASVKSVYCTFEWAYAMGQGIPILPLIFDGVSIADVPAPLVSKQFSDCQKDFPSYLREQIYRLKSIPPQVAAVNQLIYEAIYDTHRRFFILVWAGDGLQSLDWEFTYSIMSYFEQQATKAYQTLQTLMVDKAFVLSGRQYRYCWQITDLLYSFSRLHRYIGRSSPAVFPSHLASQFEDIWLPAFEYFEEKRGWWRKYIRRHFEWDLSEERNKIEVLSEIMRAFPIFVTGDAEVLIHNKQIDQSRASDENAGNLG